MSTSGYPIVAPLPLAFPTDSTARKVDDQLMLYTAGSAFTVELDTVVELDAYCTAAAPSNPPARAAAARAGR